MSSTGELEAAATAEVSAAARRCAALADAAELPPEHLGGWSSQAATEYAGCVRSLRRLLQELQDDLRSLIAAVERAS